MLEIPAQAAAAVQPGYRAFHVPPPREDGKALLVGWTLHNAEDDAEQRCCPFNEITGIGMVSPTICHTWAQVMRFSQYLFRTVTVLDVGCMNLPNQKVAFGVNHEVPLPAIDLFTAAPCHKNICLVY